MAGMSIMFKLASLLSLISVIPWAAYATVVHQKFIIGTQKVTRLCKEQEIVTVNGHFPGPTLYARDNDNVIVLVENNGPYNVTIHWHGVRQLRTCWADGPAYITQCPITPGNAFTYNFRITEQEGTLWWHAHVSFLRATVHGALVIYPRFGKPYPFPKPAAEFPVILGEWWSANVEDVIADAIQRGVLPLESDAYTINGQPGDLYECSANDTSRILVRRGKTYLIRMVNAAMNHAFFVKIAEHKLKVVAVDALYTKPYTTDQVLIQPGQTMDVLITTSKPSGLFYMAIRVYSSQTRGGRFINTTTTAILEYTGSINYVPLMPALPPFDDTQFAFKFSTDQKSLRSSVPQRVDEEMVITEGFGLLTCPNRSCEGFMGGRAVGSFNNISFLLPNIDILQAYYHGIDGVFTRDFPENPPLIFNYTQQNPPLPMSFWEPELGTKVKVLKFNSKVQIVFQNTGILTVENHPLHLHGHDFYVVGQGFGNYNPRTHPAHFNLKDPQKLNTVGVPTGGWAAIRFTANNPGVWLMHCHFESHTALGFEMVFIVEDGAGSFNSLPPPPPGLPHC
ncbi:hypothetical protein SUGI_0654060 [Cryptomeria japonica]|uniref:laccase-5 n=1 Tax=Cryptomeria japonica TaxID=3369 RepID=UPI002414A811|nr:laccase-5 [Cryptomeria japonica]GLJ32504.1 hypothetical protein SUGI_0654060 [Cryptomeria japonica]